jgi:hypothetical protein
VLNVLPPMRAGAIAVQTGLANANARWCHVNFLSFESTAAKDIHVLGDSIQIAPGMPKSGHMANSQAKVAAAAIVAELGGAPVNPAPMLNNTCYSFTGVGGAERARRHLCVELGADDLGRQPDLRHDGKAPARPRSRCARPLCRGQLWPITDAVATSSSNSAIDTVPETA